MWYHTLAKQALGSKPPTYTGSAESLGLFHFHLGVGSLSKTAILIDGGFYKKRAQYLWGPKDASHRAAELEAYCYAHLGQKDRGVARQLYRIFYYDCAPIGKKSVYHPLTRKNIELDKSNTYTWSIAFLEELKHRRKFAIRLGEMAGSVSYNLKPASTKRLLLGQIALGDLTESDFEFVAQQKGVDMRIGVDLASMTFKKQIDQVVLVSGDSDFVPAAKMARREGIDFILDPMGATIKDDLFEHIDGLYSPWKKGKKAKGDEAP